MPLVTDHEGSSEGSGLLAPDVFVPSQYFDRTRRRIQQDGERMLMLAVLEAAVNDYQAHLGAREPHRRQAFQDAEAWIESRARGWIFSFEGICDAVGLDPDHLRDGLRAWKERAQGGERGTGPAIELRGTAERWRTANGD